jgi:hypothetical protein
MYTYSVKRNGNWKAYDGNGGNCQNFGSQTLLAGGIPMDEEGTAKWYWRSHTDQNYSWINVGNFWNYANNNTGYGLVAKTNGNYYDGQVGDILIVGHSGKFHISGDKCYQAAIDTFVNFVFENMNGIDFD